MYQVDIKNKKLKKLAPIKFSDFEIKERFDIEEWIRKNPDILKENLLVIGEQKSLPSGRQTDLLALDKNGNLVIIELKRDDSGKEVYWQAITYAAQFSEYSPNEIVALLEEYLQDIGAEADEAKSKMEEFVEEDFEKINQKQRIILVSKEFHQDVLKAAKWLSEEYDLDIKCVRLAPFKDEKEDLFLISEVLIPTPGLEEYIKKKTIKQREMRAVYRSPFSLEIGNFDKGELKEKLRETLTRKTELTPRFRAFLKILLSEGREFKREEIKEKLFSVGIGKNIGQTGRYLSNISQLLTKKSTPHLRQVIEFSGGSRSGEEKDNFKINPKYRQLLKEILDEAEDDS